MAIRVFGRHLSEWQEVAKPSRDCDEALTFQLGPDTSFLNLAGNGVV